MEEKKQTGAHLTHRHLQMIQAVINNTSGNFLQASMREQRSLSYPLVNFSQSICVLTLKEDNEMNPSIRMLSVYEVLSLTSEYPQWKHHN